MLLYFSLLCLLQHAIYYSYALAEEHSVDLPPSCNSLIYCESQLLHDVQLAQLYPDSKTFVDKKLLCSEAEILSAYRALRDGYNGQTVPRDRLQQFVDEYFVDGDELEEWKPPDFTAEPSLAKRVLDPYYARWVYDLNQIWHTLARKIKDDVRTNPDAYSLIWVPNGFFIPGGRFRELYYWDTYWIVNGLLLCDMLHTARGVIENIVSLVLRFGFMPNGARKYYENRSQPPMLIPMVASYFKKTKDFAYVRSVLPALNKEFNFWMTNRMVTFQKDGSFYRMAVYDVRSRGPRPESYREDYEAAEKFNTENEKNNFYCNIKSAAESGWDFSSRWFITPDGTNRGQLIDIQTSSIVPVDLNSILHANAVVMGIWYEKIGNTQMSDAYKKIAEELLNNIQQVLWSVEKGCWFDWDLKNQKHRDFFYVSNIVPLWTGSYMMETAETVAGSVLRYLTEQNIISNNYFGGNSYGTPTSMFVSGQQWDHPNAWPPLQAFIIQGLDRTGDKTAKKVARELADVWLRTNYKGYDKHNVMFEKYDVLTAGETGGGGEYHPQTGFGWTNGVVLELLNQWGDKVSYKKQTSELNGPQDYNFPVNSIRNQNLDGCYLLRILNSLKFWTEEFLFHTSTYTMIGVSYTKSIFPDIRSSAAIFVGSLYKANPNKSSLDLISSKMLMLTIDPSPKVRASAVICLGKLYE